MEFPKQRINRFGEQKSTGAGEEKISCATPKCEGNIKLIYSSGIDLDIVPRTSDKGQAMHFLHQKWKFAAEQTVVYSNSGNDIAWFAVGNQR